MKKLFTCFALVAMLAFAGCGTFGDDNVGPNGDQTEQPNGNEDEKPNEGGDENQNPDTPKQYKIYVYNLFGWESVYIYVWDKENLTEYAGKWCGTKMTGTEEINGHTYLVYELPEAASGRELGVIFNNGQGTQTPDWFVTLDEDCYMLLLGTYPTIIQDKNNPTGNDYTDLDKIPDTHKIYYTSTDGEIVTPYKTNVFGANIGYNTYENGKGVIVFDDEVTLIGDYAFSNCRDLESVIIPDGVTLIGKSAFGGCEGLASITIPDSVTEIGAFALNYCNNSLVSIHIPDSVTSIGMSAFSHCWSLTSINIPDSVTSIGMSAFFNCKSLDSITIGKGVATIGMDAFELCSNLRAVYISDIESWCNIKFGGGTYANPLYVAKSLYLNNKLVSNLVIPDSVISIGEYAFQNYERLTSVTIGDGVTEIGERAFESCSSLTSVTIGKGVTDIEYYAFSGCSSLAKVYCKPTTPPSLAGSYSNVFYGNASGRKFYVPTERVDVYKTDMDWLDYADDIVGYDF